MIYSDQEHPPSCHLLSIKGKDGVAKQVDISCPLHSSTTRGFIHQKLCSSCGPDLPPPKPKPGVRSFAFSVKQGWKEAEKKTEKQAGKKGRVEITKCAFMSEIISLIGVDGQELRCKIQYDSLGGANFCSSLPQGYDHEKVSQYSEPFSLSTICGSSDHSLPMALLLLSTPRAGKIWCQAMLTEFPDSEYWELDEQTKRKCDITSFSEVEFSDCPAKMILGVGSSAHFPLPVPTPTLLSSRYPGLTLWRSQLTGNILFQGSLPPPMAQVSSFLSFPGVPDMVVGEEFQTAMMGKNRSEEDEQSGPGKEDDSLSPSSSANLQ